MFTGIVAAVGKIVATAPRGDGVRLVVDSTELDATDVALGDSIAVNGCCLTVVAKEKRKGGARLAFDVSAETLRCTAGLDGSADVNLEKALRFGDRLGGHMVTGHIDGVGVVTALDPVPVTEQYPDSQGSWTIEVEAPKSIARFIAAKGSIAVQGVSLTVNGVKGGRFHANLIPHTLAVTTMKALGVGARVNLEVDLLARYVARLSDPIK